MSETVGKVIVVLIVALPGLVIGSLCRRPRVLFSLGGAALVAGGLCLCWGHSLFARFDGESGSAESFIGAVLLVNGIVLFLGPVLRRVKLG